MRRSTVMMKVQLRALCLLLCVGMGRAGSLWTLMGADPRRSAAPQTQLQSRGAAAAGEARSQRSVPGAPGPGLPPVVPGASGRRTRRSPPDPPCALRSVLVQVRDLGLGYDSDEALLFKYCSGACPELRSNHDLALSSLLQSALLPEGGAAPGGPWYYAPCCRPTHHEDMAFLDNKHRWHKVEGLSAAGCRCVG